MNLDITNPSVQPTGFVLPIPLGIGSTKPVTKPVTKNKTHSPDWNSGQANLDITDASVQQTNCVSFCTVKAFSTSKCTCTSYSTRWIPKYFSELPMSMWMRYCCKKIHHHQWNERLPHLRGKERKDARACAHVEDDFAGKVCLVPHDRPKVRAGARCILKHVLLMLQHPVVVEVHLRAPGIRLLVKPVALHGHHSITSRRRLGHT